MKHPLDDLRCVLVNPFLHPSDLRGEVQTIDGDDKHERGMNYGLLVVASVLARQGAQVTIVDLDEHRLDWREHFTDVLARTDPHWVGVGSILVYSYLPTIAALALVRDRDRTLVTLVGGQNAQNFPRLLHENERGLVDYLICGDAEAAIVTVSCAIMNGTTPAQAPGITHVAAGGKYAGFTPKVPLNEVNSMLDYTLYPGHRALWPVVEESRGCPFHCDFCANSLQGGAKIRYKPPALLVAELKRLFHVYGDPLELPVVLMTSIFGVNPRLTRETFALLRNEPIRPRFVASTRVDLNFDSYIDLATDYFDQMHFGLETGSLEVVARMHKAQAPARYLSRARETFAAWHDRGVHTAANFIVGYLGETRATVEETIDYLAANRDRIDSVWGGGLMAYPDSPFGRGFSAYAQRYGSRLEDVSPYCRRLHTYPISPSADLSYTQVLEYTDHVHEMFDDEQSRYHHYKWYVGPIDRANTPGFVSFEEFQRRFELGPAVVPGS